MNTRKKIFYGFVLLILLGFQAPVYAASPDVLMDVDMPPGFVVDEQIDFAITVSNYGGVIQYEVKAYLNGTLTHETGEIIGRKNEIHRYNVAYLLPSGGYELEIELWAVIYMDGEKDMLSISHIEFTVPTEPDPVTEVPATGDEPVDDEPVDDSIIPIAESNGGCFVSTLH